MNKDDMPEAIRRSLCTGAEIEERGIDRYVVHTDFTYPDGDELRIILKKNDGQWILTDEGHTMMWLSYEGIDLDPASKSDLMSRIMASNHAELINGRICVRFKQGDAGGALHSMIQALIQTADLICREQ